MEIIRRGTVDKDISMLHHLLEQYNEKIYSKRSKQERDLIKENQVEGKSMVETKGRIVTSAGQFYLLLQKIIIVRSDVGAAYSSLV